MDARTQKVPNEHELVIGGDLNGHVGNNGGGYKRVHKGLDTTPRMRKEMQFCFSHWLMIWL